MERQFFSGNSVEQAVLAAARHHGLDPALVAYKLREKRHGYVNVRRRVVIEVDPKAPRREEPLRVIPTSNQSENSQINAAELSQADWQPRVPGEYWLGEVNRWQGSKFPDPAAAGIEHSLDELGCLMGASFQVETRRCEDVFEIEIGGDDSLALLAEEGRALYAVEHLLPRLSRRMVGEGVFCRVDSGGFRRSRELRLEELAHKAAERAVQFLGDELLEPMNPADRRVVHIALAQDPTVRTESEGEGFIKCVRVIPVEG